MQADQDLKLTGMNKMKPVKNRATSPISAVAKVDAKYKRPSEEFTPQKSYSSRKSSSEKDDKAMKAIIQVMNGLLQSTKEDALEKSKKPKRKNGKTDKVRDDPVQTKADKDDAKAKIKDRNRRNSAGLTIHMPQDLADRIIFE